MPRMTAAEYVEKGGCACPYCASPHIYADGNVEVDGSGATQEVRCMNKECQKTWIDCYTLTGIIAKGIQGG